MGRFRVHTDERGASAVLVGLVLPVLLAASALGVGLYVLGGGERELQRAADAGALAAAARMPLADPNAASPWPGEGNDPAAIACQIVESNLVDASLTSAFAPGHPTCEDGSVQVSFPRNALGRIISDPRSWDDDEDGGCVRQQDGLESSLPGVVGDTVDLSRLAPALTGSFATVQIDGTLEPPMAELVGVAATDQAQPAVDGVDVSVCATARRRFKNAVLLPVADCGALGGVMPDCEVDANPALDQTGDQAFGALEDVREQLDARGLPGGDVIELLLQDLQDIYDPEGNPPTQREVLEAALADDEDILVVVGGTAGATRIPVLDVYPAASSALRDKLLENPDPSMSDLAELAEQGASGRGLFRASLVR